MYISKDVYYYLRGVIESKLTSINDRIDKFSSDMGGEVLLKDNAHKELILKARVEVEAAARQMVEVGKTYRHRYQMTVTEYTVVSVEERAYTIRHSNGSKTKVSFGSPYNFESVEVTENPIDHRHPEDMQVVTISYRPSAT